MHADVQAHARIPYIITRNKISIEMNRKLVARARGAVYDMKKM